MLIKRLAPILLLIFIVACNGNESEQETTNQSTNNRSIQPIHYDEKNSDRYDAKEPSIGEQGGYEQSEQNDVNKSDFNAYTDPFTNEESIRISEELQKQKDIIQAQVASTDDRIVVAVMLREHDNHDITQQIEENIKKIVPNTGKQIIVYTDDVHWDRMKNLGSRGKAKSIGDDVEGHMEELFQLND